MIDDIPDVIFAVHRSPARLHLPSLDPVLDPIHPVGDRVHISLFVRVLKEFFRLIRT